MSGFFVVNWNLQNRRFIVKERIRTAKPSYCDEFTDKKGEKMKKNERRAEIINTFIKQKASHTATINEKDY